MKLSDRAMTSAIRCALRVKFEDTRRYAFLEEVGTSTGFANAGWADAVCLHLWPSDGLALWGFEIKASRTDWLKELKDLRKSEKIARFCDRWIIVAPKGLVRDGELPPAWGLWEYNHETDAIVHRVKGEERKPSKYLHRGFFAALVRRTAETLPSAHTLAMIAEAATDRARRANERRVGQLESSLKAEQQRNEKMQKAALAAGLRWNSWRQEFERAA